MKNTLIVILIVLALFASGFYFLKFKGNSTIRTDFPNYFPKEMISEPYLRNLEVLSDIQAENEKHRVLVSYISSKSEEDNKQSFKKYFEKNGFQIQDGNAGEQSFISAIKDKISVSITFWKRSPLQISIVYIISK